MRPAGVVRRLAPYSRRHRRFFIAGAVASVLFVACQLALPWPLKALLEGWSGGERKYHPAAMAALFVAFVVGAGFFEYVQRVHFARFAIGWSREVRASALRTYLGEDRWRRSKSSGELVSRLVSDVARFKAGVKIFLVYVATNLLLLGGATALVLALDPALGAVLGLAALGASVAAWSGARRGLREYLDYRTREGRLASGLEAKHVSLAFENDQSGLSETEEVRATGLATAWAHALVGLGVAGALLIGTRGVVAGGADPEALLVFLAYVLILSKPIVRLTRQGARTGRTVACAHRLVELLRTPEGGPARGVALRRRVAVEDLRLPGARAATASVRWSIDAGSRVAVVGAAASGKSSLLRVASGRPGPASGRVLWDDADAGFEEGRADVRVGFLPHRPEWERAPLEELLTGGATSLQEHVDLLLSLRVSAIASCREAGWRQRVASHELSRGERRLVRLAAVLMRRPPLIVLDEPFAGFGEPLATAIRHAIDRASRDRTLLLASAVPFDLSGFDRIVELDAGEVVFDGAPQDWVAAEGALRLWGERMPA